MYRIIILGGYGNFGKRIAESLAKNPGCEIFIAGRNLEKAKKLCESISSNSTLKPLKIDISSNNFETELEALYPDLVIHTSGPFQGQDHHVPKACIKAGSHYIDLADDRRFVCDISDLDESAKQAGVLIVSGASSVPGLSSTVIDHFQDEFSDLESIDVAIAPGNKAERGEATIRGILSYTGHPYKTLVNGSWVNTYGWMSPRRIDFREKIGKRWLANVDIPDLELFPQRYPKVKTSSFQAGLELPVLHLIMVLMAWLSKARIVPNWSPLTKAIMFISNGFYAFGTDDGAMRVLLKGFDKDKTPLSIDWTLYAYDGVGPYIPTLSTVIIANKLIKGDKPDAGAMPCLGLYSLSEFNMYAEIQGIFHKTRVKNG